MIINDRFDSSFVFAFGSECDINLSYDISLEPITTDRAGERTYLEMTVEEELQNFSIEIV